MLSYPSPQLTRAFPVHSSLFCGLFFLLFSCHTVFSSICTRSQWDTCFSLRFFLWLFPSGYRERSVNSQYKGTDAHAIESHKGTIKFTACSTTNIRKISNVHVQTSVSIGLDVVVLCHTFKLNTGNPRGFFSDCLMWKPEGIMLFCSTVT